MGEKIKSNLKSLKTDLVAQKCIVIIDSITMITFKCFKFKVLKVDDLCG